LMPASAASAKGRRQATAAKILFMMQFLPVR
jgi:hypothetical protein